MAQWKRAGPITPRSLDRNKLLLKIIFLLFDLVPAVHVELLYILMLNVFKTNVLRRK